MDGHTGNFIDADKDKRCGKAGGGNFVKKQITHGLTLCFSRLLRQQRKFCPRHINFRAFCKALKHSGVKFVAAWGRKWLNGAMSAHKVIKLNPILVIPARMASARLPGKPLADIGGIPMIVHVMERAKAANVGPVIIACAEREVADAIRTAGGTAIMTDPDLPSGTDRVRAAVETIDPDGHYDCVVNVQGDLPTLDPLCVNAALSVLEDVTDCDIATLVVPTDNPREMSDPNVVKAVLTMETADRGRALYFTRASAPSGDGPVYHHIGIYAYRRAALNRFCGLDVSPLEKRERLEQLRALESGMRIDARIVDSAPEGVDTPQDLERARKLILGSGS